MLNWGGLMPRRGGGGGLLGLAERVYPIVSAWYGMRDQGAKQAFDMVMNNPEATDAERQSAAAAWQQAMNSGGKFLNPGGFQCCKATHGPRDET